MNRGAVMTLWGAAKGVGMDKEKGDDTKLRALFKLTHRSCWLRFQKKREVAAAKR